MIRPRFSAVFNNFSSSSLQNLARFSSSSSFETNPRPASSFYHGDYEENESTVYKHKLQFQPPATLDLNDWRSKGRRSTDWRAKDWSSYDWRLKDWGPNDWRSYYASLLNSVSFIGTVLWPLKTMKTGTDKFGVCTRLQVNSSANSRDSFRVMIMMWEEMAEIACKYLKEKDFIYVSGRLGSYTKADENGHLKIIYKVDVRELNYVACPGRPQNIEQHKILKPNEEATSTSVSLGDPEPNLRSSRKMDNLYLWQVFFASPYEWWDNRNKKKSPKSPDFKHKDTGEVLWLSPSDPPWVSKQLKRHDSRMAERGYQDYGNSRSRLSMWKYDEY